LSPSTQCIVSHYHPLFLSFYFSRCVCSGTYWLPLFYCTDLVISRGLSETSRGYLPLDLRAKLYATLGFSIPDYISLCITKSIKVC
jgi:hypothetical protein